MTTAPGTTAGSTDPFGGGTAYRVVPGTAGLLVPAVTIPTDVPGSTEEGTGDGTGTDAVTCNGSTVPVAGVPRRRWSLRRRRGDENGTGTDERGSVPTGSVPTPAPAAPDEPQPAAPPPPAPATAAAPRRRLFSSDFWLWAVIWALTGVTTWMAASGQVDTWMWAGLDATDERRFGVPFVMELSVIGWLLLGKDAVSSQRSPYPWWGVAAAFSALAVFTNSVHGEGDGWWKQALIFGTASAVSLAFWFAKFYLDYIGSETAKGLRTGTRPKVLGFASAFQPRIDFRAFMIVRRREQVKTVERARELAELWIWVYQDTKQQMKSQGRRWGKRTISRRTAWMTVNKECNVRVIVPQGITLPEVTFAAPAPPPPAAGPARSGPARSVTRAVRHPTPAADPVDADDELDGDPEPVSAPPATGEAPTAPDEWFDIHTDKIAAVQARAGSAWWDGPKALTVDQVQKQYGVGNRKHASQVAKCLAVLRHQKLADMTAGTTPAPQPNDTPGGAA